MPPTATKYGILVAVDGSTASDAATAWAAREAALHKVPVTAMHAVAPVVVGWPVGRLFDDIPDWQNDKAQRVVAQARAALSSGPVAAEALDVRTEVVYANVVPALVDASADARMIVVGSTGLGAIGRLALGSVSTSLMHHARCPVAVIHADSAPPTDAPVLLGIDGSPASEAATALAFEEASRREVPLVALHAWSDVAVYLMLGMDWQNYENQAQAILGERLAGWQERYPDVEVRRRVVGDQPARWLLEESERAQLVVLGSRGRGGFAGLLLGSVSSAVAQSAKVPVIIARP